MMISLTAILVVDGISFGFVLEHHSKQSALGMFEYLQSYQISIDTDWLASNLPTRYNLVQ